ncbi:Splicing factor 1 [Trichinella britovi]|uniref:Splicing factor 1 n=1 Tax=Trichinella britovi TaxID=45882 RepID=A0A0V1CMX2_TRIBR|nr:Splicing factor 1 [Trichinella britovi]
MDAILASYGDEACDDSVESSTPEIKEGLQPPIEEVFGPHLNESILQSDTEDKDALENSNKAGPFLESSSHRNEQNELKSGRRSRSVSSSRSSKRRRRSRSRSRDRRNRDRGSGDRRSRDRRSRRRRSRDQRSRDRRSREGRSRDRRSRDRRSRDRRRSSRNYRDERRSRSRSRGRSRHSDERREKFSTSNSSLSISNGAADRSVVELAKSQENIFTSLRDTIATVNLLSNGNSSFPVNQAQQFFPTQLSANNNNNIQPKDSNNENVEATAGSRKRKSRWGKEGEKAFVPGMPTAIPMNLTKEQEIAYLRKLIYPCFVQSSVSISPTKTNIIQLQIEDVTRKLRTGDLGIPQNPEERSPSPEPVYDSFGKRLNTREVRTRQNLENERHRLILKMVALNPIYKPPADYKPPQNRLHEKVWIPQEDHPELNFVGLLIGPRGNTLKQLERETNTRIIIRGKGSVKEGKIGKRDGPLPGEDEALHAYITAQDEESLKKAVKRVSEIIRQALEVPESQNELRKLQLRELALLNGTLRGDELALTGIKCTNCGASTHKSWECPDRPNVTANVFCTACGAAGHIARDCKNPTHGGAPTGAALDEEYSALMAELGHETTRPTERDSGVKPVVRINLAKPRMPPMMPGAFFPPPPHMMPGGVPWAPWMMQPPPMMGEDGKPVMPPPPPPATMGYAPNSSEAGDAQYSHDTSQVGFSVPPPFPPSTGGELAGASEEHTAYAPGYEIPPANSGYPPPYVSEGLEQSYAPTGYAYNEYAGGEEAPPPPPPPAAAAAAAGAHHPKGGWPPMGMPYYPTAYPPTNMPPPPPPPPPAEVASGCDSFPRFYQNINDDAPPPPPPP